MILSCIVPGRTVVGNHHQAVTSTPTTNAHRVAAFPHQLRKVAPLVEVLHVRLLAEPVVLGPRSYRKN